MGREEQKEEREVLDSIFPEEITDVNDYEYRVEVVLDIPIETEDDPENPTIILQVQYPEAYPDEAPRLDIHNPQNAAKHPYFDVQEDKAQLLQSLDETIEENIGIAMVFTLVTTLKDNAEQLVAKRKEAVQRAKDQESAKAEAEENKKFEGTKVTRETFMAWQTRFKQEMELEKAKREQEREDEMKKKRMPKEEKKLSGRELWEKGLAGKTVDEEEDVDGDDALAANIETLKVK